MQAPLCFVLMPFGRKTIASGETVDFDAVYRNIIVPAIEAAGMTTIRADEERVGGLIHKPMYERLILCDFAVADLTGANANVFYELGLRHGIRPATTVLMTAEPAALPFDVKPLRTLPYQLDAQGRPKAMKKQRDALTRLLRAARDQQGVAVQDSPVFQLVQGLQPPDISRLSTDVFRDRARYAEEARQSLEDARRTNDPVCVQNAAAALGAVGEMEAGVLVDLLLSHRAVKAHQAMVDLVAQMPEPVARIKLVQEQLGFALNRLGRHQEAEGVLKTVIASHGPSGESNGLLGRVYKDRWEGAVKAGERTARSWLKKAIDTYLQGFEADWRDAYPGINAVTLMEFTTPPDPRRLALLPVVTYAVQRRFANGAPDYWDYATLLELAVLREDESAAEEHIADVLTSVRERWGPETTARNLGLIRQARAARGVVHGWADEIEEALRQRAVA